MFNKYDICFRHKMVGNEQLEKNLDISFFASMSKPNNAPKETDSNGYHFQQQITLNETTKNGCWIMYVL